MKTLIHIVIHNENKNHNTQQGDIEKWSCDCGVADSVFSPAYPQGSHED